MSTRIQAVLLAALALAAPLLWPVPASAVQPDVDTVMLVAKRGLKDPLYGASVLVARPLGGGRHVGFIVNKPTRVRLGQAFPAHGPSQKIAGPLFLGGPADANVLFALVRRESSPGPGSLQLTPDLFLAIAGDTIDRIIEAGGDHARFLMGIVVWRPGELSEELKRGLWHVQAPEAGLLLRANTDGLWEELVRRGEDRANMI